jgi:hypothetical protein
VSLRAKWRLLESRGGRPAVAARFGVTLPETSYNDIAFRPLGLGPNTLRAFVQGLFGWRFGGTRLDLNLGLLVFDDLSPARAARFFTRPAFAQAAGRARGRHGDRRPPSATGPR